MLSLIIVWLLTKIDFGDQFFEELLETLLKNSVWGEIDLKFNITKNVREEESGPNLELSRVLRHRKSSHVQARTGHRKWRTERAHTAVTCNGRGGLSTPQRY